MTNNSNPVHDLRRVLEEAVGTELPVAGTSSTCATVGNVRSTINYADLVDVGLITDPEDGRAVIVLSIWDATSGLNAIAALAPDDAGTVRSLINGAVESGFAFQGKFAEQTGAQ